jgi:hypothetical protein
MATKFTITEVKGKPTSGGHYEKESEHRMELRRISALEKELKHHEAQGLGKAHKGGSQKDAPIPSMRSY